MNRFVVAVAAALVAFGGYVGFLVTKATAHHPHARHVIFAVENEATKLVRHGFAATGRCGVERWDEKTLAASDPASAQVLASAPLPTNIVKLRAMPVPANSSGFRSSAESVLYRLSGTWLIAYKLELDSDIHLELQSALDGSTMIAEIADPGCVSNPAAKALVAAARDHFVTSIGQPLSYYTATHVRVSVMGPAFFDFVHGQKGVAPNGIELHPLLTFRRWQ